jgi:penicillin-binding protein 2
MSSSFNENEVFNIQKKRLNFIAIIFSVIFLLILARIFFLQIIRGNHYYYLAKNNATRVIYLPAPRGYILSDNGKVMVDNESSFNIAITLAHVKSLKKEIRLIAAIFHKKYSKLYSIVKKEEFIPNYESIVLIRNLSIKDLSVFEVNKLYLPGFFIEKIPIRHYPYENMGAQIFGYVGLISSAQLKEKKYSYVNPSDIVGETGIEYYYQKYLHGEDGEKRVVVNSSGKTVGKVMVKKPKMGDNIYTTINLSLEKLAYKLMKNKEGAVIAMNPRNGKILAMVSTPSFNPVYFSKGVSVKEWGKIINNDEHPLQDKAIQNSMAPGSTFKIVGALAGLETHLITPDKKIFAGPTFKLGNAVFYNWNPNQNSKIDLYTALEESVDTYFYSIATKLHISQIAHYAHLLGFGKKTGIDLPAENPGFIPTRKLVYKVYHRRWYKGSTLSSIIGQSYVSITPIQLIEAYSAIANGGYLYKPYIVNKIVSSSGKIIRQIKSRLIRRIKLKKSYVEAIKKGLYEVVNGKNGTALNGKIRGISFCGKTGTAQIISKTYSIYDAKNIPRRDRDNAWFVGFAPMNNPKIAVVILDMHAKFLGAHAAIIAKKIVEKYLEQKGLWKPSLKKRKKNNHEKLPSFIYTKF